MGGLLDHARNFFRGFSAPAVLAPQRYSVTCPEGHPLSGVRTDGYQALRCPVCGDGIFILPRSPLPEPSNLAPGRASSKGSKAPEPIDEPVALTDPVRPRAVENRDEADEELAEIEWVDEAAPAAPPSGPVQHRPWPDPGEFAAEEIERAREKEAAAVAAAESRPRPKEPKPAASARPPRPRDETAPAGARGRKRPARDAHDPYAIDDEPAPARPRTVALPAPRVRDRLRRHRNLLIFSTVGLVVLATVAYRIHRARMLALPGVAELGWSEGLAALDAGRFDAARQVLSNARDAVDTLGDHSEKAEAIRQGAREIAILTRLSPDPLEELLDQASQLDAKEWTERFSRLYKGRTIVVEANVTAVPDSRGDGEYDLTYRVFRPGEGDRPPSMARLDLRRFELIQTLKPRVGDHLLFGAALAGFVFDRNADEWRIALEPESGVTMIHRQALETLGWPSVDAPSEDGQP